MLSLLKKLKLPLILLAVLVLPMLLGGYIPLSLKAKSYALSLSMKSVLELVLPFIIFSFVFSCLGKLRQGALFFVGLLVSSIFVSNFTALNLAYVASKLGFNYITMAAEPVTITQHLVPAWHFSLGHLVSNEVALVLGFVLGIYFSIRPSERASRIGQHLNYWANVFLKRCFIPLLPLFVLGFVFKLEYEKVLEHSLSVYGPVLLLIVTTQWLYLGFWYTVASGFSLSRLSEIVRNVLPATLTGFSTISSAASMPVLLIAAEKNLKSKEQADIIVPAIVNIHTIGSAIGMPILAMATLMAFGEPAPSYSQFIVFAFFTALAKYAVAAVPGGVIIVVAPLLQTYLGFSGDMVGLITAVYLILDPFGTAANVTGNGVFPILFDKFYTLLRGKPLAADITPSA